MLHFPLFFIISQKKLIIILLFLLFFINFAVGNKTNTIINSTFASKDNSW